MILRLSSLSSRLRKRNSVDRRGSGNIDDKVLSCVAEDIPETEASSTSSGVLSHDSDDCDESDCNCGFAGSDPYADVRDRMEELSAADYARYAVHSDTEYKHISLEDAVTSFNVYTTYFSYAVLLYMGQFYRFLEALCYSVCYLFKKKDVEWDVPSHNPSLFAPLCSSWDHFFTVNVYKRIQDCWNRPIGSNPGSYIDVIERVSDDNQHTMKVLGPLENLENGQQCELYRGNDHFVELDDGVAARHCLNLGSYNYLGFGDDWKDTCGTDVIGSLKDFPVSTSSCRTEYGTTALHRKVEETVASFLGKEDAICLNMGFNTNATTIPALVGRGDLIISDANNHTSLVNGARASGAAIRVFRHNDMEHLDEIVREAIVMGRPKTRRPWNKILVVVEGIYSMEGEYCDLQNIVRICKKYGAYLYLDEAHSIGAMGPTGRGCSEYTGVDPADVDILMGTFTKSFGAMGGYIAADKKTISFLRRKCAGSIYHNALSPAVCQQVISAFNVSKVDNQW